MPASKHLLKAIGEDASYARPILRLDRRNFHEKARIVALVAEIQVHALLELAASRTPQLQKVPKPYVLQSALSDFYTQYQLNAAITRPQDRPFALSRLHAEIQDAFNEYGVQIMSPNFEAQPEGKVVVPREQWHAAPADNVDAAA